ELETPATQRLEGRPRIGERNLPAFGPGYVDRFHEVSSLGPRERHAEFGGGAPGHRGIVRFDPVARASGSHRIFKGRPALACNRAGVLSVDALRCEVGSGAFGGDGAKDL